MLRSIHTARSAAARRLSTFAGQSYYRTRIEPLESRHLLSATLISVDTFDDVIDASDGVTSLREAIREANASPDDYEIELAAGTYPLTIQGTFEDDALTGDLDILANSSLKITGAGAELTTIDAAGLMGSTFGDRVIDVLSGAVLELQSVKLTGGSANWFGEHGGAIQNAGGQVTVTDSKLMGNSAREGGGAIYNFGGGQMAITGGTVSENVANNGAGGAIYNSDDGVVTIAGSTVNDNGGVAIYSSDGVMTITTSTVNDNGGRAILNSNGVLTITASTISGNGGGVYNSLGQATIDNSTFEANSVFSNFQNTGGGAVYNAGGQVTIDDSTFEANSVFSNSSNTGGGAVYNDDGQVTINHSTFVANSVFSDSSFNAGGGGVYNTGGQLTINHSAFEANSATGKAAGGGIHIKNGTVQINQNSLAGNAAVRGGGIYSEGALTITASTLSDNTADQGGGAIFIFRGPATVVGSTLSGNISNTDGGAILNNRSQLEVDDSTLSGNSATYGGGIHNSNDGQVDILESTISDNTANVGGGGIFNAGDGQVTITHSTLSANTAQGDGGGIYNATGGAVTAINSTLSGNAANSFGGGIFSGFGGSPVTLSHSTLTGNRADADTNLFGAGGGLYLAGGTVVALDHTIVAGNFRRSNNDSDIESDLADPIDPASGFSLVGDPDTAGGLVHGTNGNIVGDGLGNLLPTILILDPNLVDNGGPTLTHALHVGSPAINAGDPLFDPNTFDPPLTFDQRGPGYPRVVEGRIDIGAYESVPNPPPVDGMIVVDVFEDSLAADGLWSLREAVIYANSHPGDFEIKLAAGTYPLTIPAVNGAGAVTGSLGIFDNGRLKITGASAATTTIDAGFRFDEADGILAPVFFVRDATVDFVGLTITGGLGGFGAAIDSRGGQVTISSSVLSNNYGANATVSNVSGQMTITDSIVRENDIDFFAIAAGIYNYDGTMTIERTTVAGNSGAGIYNDLGQLTVIDSTVFGNTLPPYLSGFESDGGIVNHDTATIISSTILNNVGGGIKNTGTVTIIASTISGNTNSGDGLTPPSLRGGGGLENSGTATIADSTISDNVAADHGGAILNHGTVTITDSTLSGNSAYRGGAISIDQGTATFTHVTISGNTADSGGGGIYGDGGDVSLTNVTISENSASGGGGIYIDGATVALANVTISENSAVRGGGIYSEGAAGQLTVRHTTITGNRATSAGSSSSTGGGLIFRNGATALLENTIVAGNFRGAALGATPSDIELSGGQLDVASSYNLIGDPDSAGGLVHGTAGNIVGDGLGNLLPTSQILDPNLANNGGPTQTHALVAGSQAINAGDPLFDPNAFDPPLTFDQRGPGYPRVLGSVIDIGAFEMQFEADVLARRIFYNNSAFDENTPGASPSDDLAIATDKSAYRPDSGSFTYANATNYSKGINGIMVEVAGPHGTFTAADFTVRMSGQQLLANSTPSSWLAAPTPTVVVFPDTPTIGTDRIELIWPDGAIVDRYLQVTVEGFDAAGGFNVNTGLVTSDVFYFANLIGDTFNSYPGFFNTDATDELEARNNQGYADSVTNAYDFNRDQSVDASDQIIARNNPGYMQAFSISSPPAPSPDDNGPAASAVVSALSMPTVKAKPRFGASVDATTEPAWAQRSVARRAVAASAPSPVSAQVQRVLRARNSVDAAFDDDLLDSLLADLKLW